MCKALAGRDRRASWDGEVDYDGMLAFYTEYFSEGESLVDESSQNTKNSELLCRFFGVERPLEAGMPTDLLYHERVYLPSAGELLTHYGQGSSWRVGDQRLSAGQYLQLHTGLGCKDQRRVALAHQAEQEYYKLIMEVLLAARDFYDHGGAGYMRKEDKTKYFPRLWAAKCRLSEGKAVVARAMPWIRDPCDYFYYAEDHVFEFLKDGFLENSGYGDFWPEDGTHRRLLSRVSRPGMGWGSDQGGFDEEEDGEVGVKGVLYWMDRLRKEEELEEEEEEAEE